MTTTIICPQCKATIDISEALAHEYASEFADKHKQELEVAKKSAEEKAFKKAAEEAELRMKDKENEAKEAKELSKKQQEEILELMRSQRELKEKDSQREIEAEKKLNQERDIIRLEAQKKAEEEQRTLMQEKDKQLSDALKEIDESRRKLQQGSQQTQGETFELEFEQKLKQQYPNDKILPVGKGIKGGDVIQEVWDSRGNFVGKILWELKNTKTWSEGWIDKLKIDKRTINAEEAVLISEVLPSTMKTAGFRDGVWVTQHSFSIPLCDTIRSKVIQIYYVRQSVQSKDEKMEALYTYLTGTEFRHRIEAIIDAFTNMQEEIEKEKRYFSNKWSRDEKSIRMVIDSTYGMHGDLKGIIGNALSQVRGIDALLEDGTK